jgi:tetratricopeptide (TPR) repeat protein
VVARIGIHYFFAHRGETRRAQAARERALRVTPAAVLALAPLSAGVPLIERPGTDAYGYPLSYVDRVALRGLLARGKYAELSKYIEQFQVDAEADFHKEYFSHECADAFESAEHDLDPNFDAWVQATPDSFAPYLARGVHRFALGFAQRGTDFAAKTAAENFTGMEAGFALAFTDLEHALRINPRLMPARRTEIRIAFTGSAHRAEFNAMCARAFEICPACFQIRVTQQIGLEPRWSGSYEQMAAAARAAKRKLNPRFELLPGYELLDRAEVLVSAKNYQEALALYQRAQALGESSDFLDDLAHDLERLKDEPGALKAVSRALELRPQRPELLFFRAHLYARAETRNYEAAYKDMVLGLRLDPTDTSGRSTLRYVAQGLDYEAGQAQQRGDNDGALRLLDESMDLYPNRGTEQRRSNVLTSGFHGTAQELTALENAATAAPHDFYAHARLDYALSQTAQWQRIATMWAAFIAQNPDEGRAYYERSGTYHQLGQPAPARADAVRACELGVNVACARAALAQ